MADRRSLPVRWPSTPPDPEVSSDRRIRQLVHQLKELPSGPSPAPDFRRDLRLQLVAVAPRLIAEGAAEAGPARAGEHSPAHLRATAAAHADASPPAVAARRVARAIGRPFRRRSVAVLAGALAFLLVLLGGAVLVSRNALPGDSLYGLKRAREDVQLTFTSGNAAKGHAYLVQAQTRVEEVTDLLSHSTAMAAGSRIDAGGGIGPAAAALIGKTLDSSDNDLRDGVQLLTTEAVRTVSASPLELMIGWFPGQLQRATAILDRLPAGALHDRAAMSLRLVDDAQQRVTALSADTGCSCLSITNSDNFGPLPCADPCTPPLVTPGGTGSAAPGTGSSGGRNASHGSDATGASGTPTAGGAGEPTDYPPGGRATVPSTATPTSAPLSGASPAAAVLPVRTAPTSRHLTSTPKKPPVSTTPPASTR